MAKQTKRTLLEQKILTAEDLKRYEAGEMTFQEMNRVEKILLEQPLYAEALEGFKKLKEDKIATQKNTENLKARFRQRVGKPVISRNPGSKVTRQWLPIGIAAALLIAFVGVYYWIKDPAEKTLVSALLKQESTHDNVQEPTLTESIIPSEERKKNIIKNKQQDLPKTASSTNKSSLEVTEFAGKGVGTTIEETKNTRREKIAESLPSTPLASPTAGDSKANIEKDELIDYTLPKIGESRLGTATITAKVLDEDHEPLKDVTVHIRGKIMGVKTDDEGLFNLKGARRGDFIVFNSLLLPQMEIPLKSVESGTVIYSKQTIDLQNKPKISVNSPNEIIFEKKASPAKPEYGWEAFELYLKENIKVPNGLLKSGTKGRIVVSFKVSEKGELSDFSIIKSLGSGYDEEAIRLIKEGPKWFPATKDETPISGSKQVVVRFR